MGGEARKERLEPQLEELKNAGARLFVATRNYTGFVKAILKKWNWLDRFFQDVQGCDTKQWNRGSWNKITKNLALNRFIQTNNISKNVPIRLVDDDRNEGKKLDKSKFTHVNRELGQDIPWVELIQWVKALPQISESDDADEQKFTKYNEKKSNCKTATWTCLLLLAMCFCFAGACAGLIVGFLDCYAGRDPSISSCVGGWTSLAGTFVTGYVGCNLQRRVKDILAKVSSEIKESKSDPREIGLYQSCGCLKPETQ